ncbi:MAG: Hsp20/alpha crystallin family protein [Smithella sp.]
MKVKNLLPAMSRKNKREDDHPFYSLQHQINNLFDDFFSGFEVAPRGLTAGGFGAFIPSVDVKENEKDIIIQAELPGVDEKDISVTVTRDSVTIKGEKKEEKEDKEKNYYYVERSYGSFHRVIPLAEEADSDNARASFKNGVLNISIPKSPKAKTEGIKVPIQTE